MSKRTIKIDKDLIESLEPILSERSVTLDAVVNLYLRAMLNSLDSGKALGMKDTMPFGKYRGALVETIVAADPGYLRYLIGTDRPLQVEPEVLAALS